MVSYDVDVVGTIIAMVVTAAVAAVTTVAV
jgi:hypothetical protein